MGENCCVASIADKKVVAHRAKILRLIDSSGARADDHMPVPDSLRHQISAWSLEVRACWAAYNHLRPSADGQLSFRLGAPSAPCLSLSTPIAKEQLVELLAKVSPKADWRPDQWSQSQC